MPEGDLPGRRARPGAGWLAFLHKYSMKKKGMKFYLHLSA